VSIVEEATAVELTLAGLVLIAVAAMLYFISQSNARLVMEAVATGVSTIADLRVLHQRVAGEVGSGLFRQQVGLQGRIGCDQPLTSELARATCVAYRFRVQRRREEEVEVRGPDGKTRRETRSGIDTVASNDRRVAFWLDDGSDRIPVNPDGARIDMEKAVDRFEPGNPPGLIRFGAFQLTLTEAFGRRRTLGYHYREDVLPVDRFVYVLGSASDSTGALGIARTPGGKTPFLISLSSREELVTSARRTAAYTLYAACVCGPLGLVLALVGLLHR
jgi:hypothetical protein